MKYLLIICTSVLLFMACNNAAEENFEAPKDAASTGSKIDATKVDDNHQPVDSSVIDSAAVLESKTMTMTFDGYSEGDYPHFNFTDKATGGHYDFQHLNKNNLSGVPFLIRDESMGFGYAQNKTLVGKTFNIKAQKQKVNWNDLQGKPVVVEGWVIYHVSEQ